MKTSRGSASAASTTNFTTTDFKRAFHGRNYTDTEFYHTLLMSNHMESDPAQFADGIRGDLRAFLYSL